MRGVLFDLDNTLFDRDHTFLAWAQWFTRERLGLPVDAAGRETVDLLVAMDANGYGSRAAMFQEIKRRHPALAATVERLMTDFYQEHVSHVALGDDTRRLLEALDRANLPFGIITNGSAHQMLKIERLGLARRTDCVYISEVFGARKPAASIFLAAAGTLGLPPAEILFVGDNPEADIAGAAGVGMRTAWLRRGRAWPDHLSIRPDHAIDALTDLLWLADR